MAQLKAGSTVGGVEIAKKDWTSVTTAFPSGLVTQLKGDDGTDGAIGVLKVIDKQTTNILKLNNPGKTWTVSGSTLNITS